MQTVSDPSQTFSNFMSAAALRRATEHAVEFEKTLKMMEKIIADRMLYDAQHGRWSHTTSMHDFDDMVRGYTLSQYARRIIDDLTEAGYAVESDEDDCFLAIYWKEEE